jgi:hypothetical protein
MIQFGHDPGRDNSEDIDVEGKIIVKWISRNNVGRCGLDSSGLEQGPVAGPCEHANKPSEFH